YPDPAQLDPADPLQPDAERGHQLHPRGDGPVSEPVSPHPAARRRRWLRARPEPDHRDLRAVHSPRDRGGRDRPWVSAESLRASARALACASLVMALDQITKQIAVAAVDPGHPKQ